MEVKSFIEDASLINYNENTHETSAFDKEQFLDIKNNTKTVNWLNVYGFDWKDEIKSIIKTNQLHDFLNILVFEDDQKNKMIDLDRSLYLTINVLIRDENEFKYDRIKFYFQDNFLFTIQEKKGDYFEGVRDYLATNNGIVRRKKGDYLLFKLLESIIDNYEDAYQNISKETRVFQDIDRIKLEEAFIVKIEHAKQDVLELKKSLTKLKEVLLQLERWDNQEFHNHYFTLLKEQINFVIDDVDFDLQQIESNLNLIFNLQSHKLNEVMKTLTIFSVIFIPLTFLAGIYGVNFVNIPETQSQYGYFVVLGVMVLVTIISVIIFKKKRWF
ncbi:MAG: magnesium transporter [Arenicella sp.]|jgi:magnesium transporter